MAITARAARAQYSKLSASARARYDRAATNQRTGKLSNAQRHSRGMRAAGSAGG